MSGLTVKLQIWDSNSHTLQFCIVNFSPQNMLCLLDIGSERYRSIQNSQYRGTDAALLCFDVTEADRYSYNSLSHTISEIRNCFL